MISVNLSALPKARPPETMILAEVNSGRSFLAISLPMNVLRPLSATALTALTTAVPPVAGAGSKPVVRTVITHWASRL